MKKPLIFRNQRYGGEYAQRDNIQYELHYSHWVDGKTSECPYHVTRWDIKNKEYISTERVKRFTTSKAAKQYCQDMYDGKVDLSVLKVEIQADNERRENERSKIALDGAEKFKDMLCKKGITLTDFLDLFKAWVDTSDTSRSILYAELKENKENEICKIWKK